MAGAPPEVIEVAKKRSAPPQTDFEVWEENWLSLAVFLTLSTQWNVTVGVGSMHWSGINYGSVPIVLRRHKVSWDERDRVFDDIRLMEQAAKEVLNKQEN